MAKPVTRLSPMLGARTARRHSGGVGQRDPHCPLSCTGSPAAATPRTGAHSSGTVTWPQGPTLTPVVPAQLPGPHPAPPVRPQVLSASCPESPSPGLPLSLPGPALSCHHSPLHALPNRRPSRCPQASRLVLGGGGNSPLATSEGRWREGPRLQPSPTAPAPALQDPHLFVLPIPAWREVRPLLSLWKDQPELPLELLLSRTQEGLLLALSHCPACSFMCPACPAHSRHQWWPRWWGSGAPRGCDVLGRANRNQETSERDSRLRTARMGGSDGADFQGSEGVSWDPRPT